MKALTVIYGRLDGRGVIILSKMPNLICESSCCLGVKEKLIIKKNNERNSPVRYFFFFFFFLIEVNRKAEFTEKQKDSLHSGVAKLQTELSPLRLGSPFLEKGWSAVHTMVSKKMP